MQYNYENKQKTHANGDTMSLHVRWTHMPPVAGELIYSNFESQAGIIPSEDNETPATPLHMSYNMVLVANNQPFTGTLALQYDAKDNRQETVQFHAAGRHAADRHLARSGRCRGVDRDQRHRRRHRARSEQPEHIGSADRRHRAQWLLSRPTAACGRLEYLISVARAHILAKARAVSISWDCSFARAIDLSCRKNASIQDDRLPGGGATGKITAYSLICDGDAGITDRQCHHPVRHRP